MTRFIIAMTALMLGGCVSYSVTEQEMTNYLQDSVILEQEVVYKTLCMRKSLSMT